MVGLDDANTVRAGVFGVQDGIVSTFGLVMGVAGAQVTPETVLIAGIAGAFSGAVSMGAGEYVSVRVQHEMIAARGGRDPENVNPLRAAIANAGLFVLGAAFPLAPFLYLVGMPAVITSSSLSIAALFLTGALLTRLTRRSPWRSGFRMLLIGGGAGVLGYAVGSILGVAVG